MNERLKELRKKLNLTQQEFSDKLGISRSNIATYETGKSNLGDSVISLICKEFNVSEDWLRDGIGEMFLPVDRETEIARMVKSLLKEENNTFKSRLISVLLSLTPLEWEAFEKKAREVLDVEDLEEK